MQWFVSEHISQNGQKPVVLAINHPIRHKPPNLSLEPRGSPNPLSYSTFSDVLMSSHDICTRTFKHIRLVTCSTGAETESGIIQQLMVGCPQEQTMQLQVLMLRQTLIEK